MDIILQTQDPNAALAFRRVVRCDDDYTCLLVVRSGGFTAEHQFLIGGDCLAQFCKDIRSMDSTLRGSARLAYRYETDEIIFDLDKLGHVFVKGSLTEYGPPEQELQFGFRTDQTCFAPLVRDFEAVMKAAQVTR